MVHPALYHTSESDQCQGKSIKGKSLGRFSYVCQTPATHGWGLPELEAEPISLPTAACGGFFLELMLSVFLVWT